MEIKITDLAKRQIEQYGFDEDEVRETIRTPKNRAITDNITLCKKSFNSGEYCYVVDGIEQEEKFSVMEVRKIYSDLPSGNIDIEDISAEEVWKQLHRDFGKNFPNRWDEPLRIYLHVFLKDREYLAWLKSH